MLIDWIETNALQVLTLLIGGGALKYLFDWLRNRASDEESARATRHDTADSTVAAALTTLKFTVDQLEADRNRLIKRVTDLEDQRALWAQQLQQEREDWQHQMAELRAELVAVEEKARRDHEDWQHQMSILRDQLMAARLRGERADRLELELEKIKQSGITTAKTQRRRQ